jgi:hypothetical protein
MSARILLFAIFFIVSAYAEAQADTGPASDVSAVHHVIDQYAKAVDTVDLNLLSQIWSFRKSWGACLRHAILSPKAWRST